jgi:hypothetical protein
MAAEIYHWQCDFCGAIAHSDVRTIRRRCIGTLKGKKCNAFMRSITDDQLATNRSAAFNLYAEMGNS